MSGRVYVCGRRMRTVILLALALSACAPIDAPYTHCTRDDGTCGTLSCDGVGNENTSFVCTPRCQIDDDCPRPVNTHPVCVVGGCLLACSSGTECPAGLECYLPDDGRMGVCG